MKKMFIMYNYIYILKLKSIVIKILLIWLNKVSNFCNTNNDSGISISVFYFSHNTDFLYNFNIRSILNVKKSSLLTITNT